MFSQDYEDLFSTLNTFKIKYLVVGAQAVVFYTEPRFTKDMDVWIPTALNDPKRVYEALKAFGAPLKDLSPEDFGDPTTFLQMGVAPVRIDILTGLAGVSATEAWKHRTAGRYGKMRANFLSLSDLIKSKRAVNRPQDQLDLHKLTRTRRVQRRRKP